ncbi:LutC/YkgG family protein [Tellurirhabdus rosea]|uniref:LutC/YkgG family protein n=1 Tax=Tellurirhabdus rosea TaxID=2674997 RepID=UPI002252C159|nr:LUD domain-containing protein [Tellurirhabdus rosea]
MSSRDQILAAIRQNRPETVPAPILPEFGGDASLEKFTTILESIGGRVVRLESEAALPAYIKSEFPEFTRIASPLFPASVAITSDTPKPTLETIELAVLKGDFGVAENGAIWVPEPAMLNRSLPFITQHLVLVIAESSLVPTMHVAYERIRHPGGYGVFIAGPSKTADIEQSLVIGAHGARTMTAVVVP